MAGMLDAYIHGRDPGETSRLEEQAAFISDVLLDRVVVPSGPGRVLDLGCGVGAMTRRLIERGAARPVGVDLSVAQAREARRLTPAAEATFLAADGAALPFPDAAFDLVYTSWFFEHVPRVRAALSEALRVLAPGGSLWAAEVENSSLVVWPPSPALEESWRAFNQAQIDCQGDPFIGRKFFSLLEGAGFVEVDVWPHTFHAHAGRPRYFTLVVKEFEGILRSGRASVVERRLATPSTYDRAIHDLASLPEKSGGTFTYTFLRARGRKASAPARIDRG
jgi:SAM-dependent methyltransferase